MLPLRYLYEFPNGLVTYVIRYKRGGKSSNICISLSLALDPLSCPLLVKMVVKEKDHFLDRAQ